jgi:Two component regulator propeller
MPSCYYSFYLFLQRTRNNNYPCRTTENNKAPGTDSYTNIRCCLQDRVNGATGLTKSPGGFAFTKSVFSMIQDKTGNIWFGTGDMGLCCYDGKSFTHFKFNDSAFKEEPDLYKRFGEAYKTYKENVPGWIPVLRPYSRYIKYRRCRAQLLL